MSLLGIQSLRGRVVLAFGAGVLLACSVFAATTYYLSRHYLLEQRERTVLREAFADANFIQNQLTNPERTVPEAMRALRPHTDTRVLVLKDGRWFRSTPSVAPGMLPAPLRQDVEAGNPGFMRANLRDVPQLYVGITIPSVDTTVYHVVRLQAMQSTLSVLGTVLVVGALVAAGLAAVLGLWASRRVLRPLDQVAGTAAAIAGGDLTTRVPATDDPDLATIVGSFNSMVDALAQRIERDARFAGDVSHELRTPLTALVASVDILQSRRAELSERARQALDLTAAELTRFRRLLDDLIELARGDAGLGGDSSSSMSVGQLLAHTLESSGRSADLLSGELGLPLRGDKVGLTRTFSNLFDNADAHGGGLVAVSAQRRGDEVLVFVDDAGPGVPLNDRERIFARFARGSGGRGSSSGTGLGLALVARLAGANGGSVWCTDRPGGGARFVVRLRLGEI